MPDSIETVREALEWYAYSVGECRKLPPDGDNARRHLATDGGSRAREALGALAHADAALSAPAEGWRPIETAPKDGTHVLLGRFVPGCERDGRIERDHYRTEGEVAAKAGFEGWGKFNPQHWPATHWMPLPPPPSNTEGE